MEIHSAPFFPYFRVMLCSFVILWVTHKSACVIYLFSQIKVSFYLLFTLCQ
ncbi:MAG: hypothetical protein ACI88A_003610 [Paraglaciecola sp.]|jgi:hypothetical protein